MRSTIDLKSLDRIGNLKFVSGLLTIYTAILIPTCEAEELYKRLGFSDDDITLGLCGTVADNCGGAICVPVT